MTKDGRAESQYGLQRYRRPIPGRDQEDKGDGEEADAAGACDRRVSHRFTLSSSAVRDGSFGGRFKDRISRERGEKIFSLLHANKFGPLKNSRQ